MEGETAVDGTGLGELPSEILSEIIRFLLDDIALNKRSGYSHSYYTPDHRKANDRSTNTLLDLCLVSRRLREVATVFLYRHIILVPRGLPGLPTSSHPQSHDSIVPLSLFLRSLLERPELRILVHGLDCRFFLRRVESMQTTSGPSVSTAGYSQEIEFYQRTIQGATHPSRSSADLILEHVAATEYEHVSDISERVLAAILCLTPQLRSLALAPLPCTKWCYVGTREQQVTANSEDDCSYHTLTSLLESARQTNVSPGLLQQLEKIRFTGVMGFKPTVSNAEAGYHPNDDPTLRIWPEYTFPLSTCLELLQGPNIIEFEADGLDEFIPDAFHIRNLPMHSSIKRAYITTPHPVLALENIGHIWNLTALGVRPAQLLGYYDEADFDALANLDLWDKSLLNTESTLKELDLGYIDGYELPSQELRCLPFLEALEHLCIGIPLLAKMERFSELSLDSLLPPNLKTLRIHDWVSGDYYDTYFPGLEYLEWTEDEAEDGLRPLVRFQVALSASLQSFAKVCGVTQRPLRSIMVFGFRPVDRTTFYSGMNNNDFYTTAHELELSGPEPGQVVRDGRIIRELFSASGVEFEELFHAQEVHMSFRDAQVSRYR